jgi:hypothetical protein
VGRKFELKKDPRGLKHIFYQSDINSRQIRWSELLSEYDFDIKYIKGTLKNVVHALGQRPHIFSVIPLKISL